MWQEWTDYAILNPQSEVVEYQSVGRDITDRKRVEEQLRESEQRLRTLFEGSVLSLSKLSEMRDPYIAGHHQRVAELACAIAERLGFDRRRNETIRIAGLLHDIGKSAVPAEILTKPTKLSDLEFGMIKGHSQAGYSILKGIPFPQAVPQVALQHHERLDGSGYPQGLKGEEILLEARILAVADVVEAMASHRPYRPALGTDKALEEIQTHRGTRYDADIVDACLELFAEGFAFSEEG